MRRIHGFRLVVAVALAAGVALGGLRAGPAHAGSIVVLPRPGQVGFSASGLYGTLLDNGNVGGQFGSGPGLAVRMRYRMRYERGFGLSFEVQGLDPREGDQVDFVTRETIKPDAESAYKRFNLFLYGADFYQMFGTRTKTTKMVSVGAGLAHPVFALNNGDQQFAFGDGAYLSAGAGIERFFWQSVAADVGGRYQAVFINGKLNHDLQLYAGLIMYASL